ncbi:MAG: CopG family transcriptional regulator [Longimicrobiales bacterium]
MKRNITIVLTEASARWVRMEAARRDTSVSRYLGELVARERERTERYGEAMSRFLGRRPRPLGPSGEPLPTREQVHER